MAETKEHHLEGCILFEKGPPAGEATLRLYHRVFNGKKMQFAEREADVQGAHYITSRIHSWLNFRHHKKIAEYRK